MRELKFRAWDAKFGVMLADVAPYGNDNIIVVDVTFNQSYGDRIDDRVEAGIEEAGFEHVCITGDLVIEQFISIRDKKGVGIYEGDIVRLINDPLEEKAQHMQGIGKVIFNDRENSYRAQRKDQSEMMLCWGGTESIEVIGNIHQNPELLS